MATFDELSEETSLKPAENSGAVTPSISLPANAVKNVNAALSVPDYEGDAISMFNREMSPTQSTTKKETVYAYPELNQADLFPGYNTNPHIANYSGSIVGTVPLFAYANNLFPIGTYHKQKAAIMEKMSKIDEAKLDPIKYTVPQISGEATKGFQPTLSKAVVNLVERQINEAANKGVFGKSFSNSSYGRKANKILEYGNAAKTQLDGVSKSIEYVNSADYTKFYISPQVKKIVTDFTAAPEKTFGVNGTEFLEDDKKFSDFAERVNKFNSTVKVQNHIFNITKEHVLGLMQRQKKGVISSDPQLSGYSAQHTETHTEYFDANDVMNVVENISFLNPDLIYNEDIYNNFIKAGDKETAEQYKKSGQLYNKESYYSLVASMVGVDAKYPGMLGVKETKSFSGQSDRPVAGMKTDAEKVTTAALTATNDILDMINSVDGKRKELGGGAYAVKAGSFITISDKDGNTREIPLTNPNDILSSMLLASEGKVYGTGVENPTAQVAQFATSSQAWQTTAETISGKFNNSARYDFSPETAIKENTSYSSGYPTSRVTGKDAKGKNVFKKVQSSEQYDFVDKANIIGKHSIGTPVGDGLFIKNVESVAGNTNNLKFKLYDAKTSTAAKEGVIIPSSVLNAMSGGQVSFVTGTGTKVNQTPIGGKYTYIEGATLIKDKNDTYNVMLGGNKVNIIDQSGNQKSLQLSNDVLEAVFSPQFTKLKTQVFHSPNTVAKTTATQLVGDPAAGKVVVAPSSVNTKVK